jgi:hypothetical protein
LTISGISTRRRTPLRASDAFSFSDDALMRGVSTTTRLSWFGTRWPRESAPALSQRAVEQIAVGVS